MPDPVTTVAPKSAVRVEGTEEIARLLYDLSQKEERSGSLSTLLLDADEGPILQKEISSAGEGAPPLVAPDDVEGLARAVGINFQDAHRDRVVSYWASDERVDGDGDIVRQVWDFSRFEANPVMPYCHDWMSPPVANAIRWGVTSRKDGDYSGPALYLAGLFPTADESVRADTVYRLVRAGFLRGGSVGFRPQVITRIEDDKEREALGLGPWGVIFERAMLLEFSPCTIPANPGAHTALATAKKAGLLRADDVSFLREAIRRDAVARRKNRDDWSKEDLNLISLAKTLFPSQTFSKHEDIEAPIVPADPAPTKVSVSVGAIAAKKKALEDEVAAIRTALDEGIAGISQRLDQITSTLGDMQADLEEIDTDVDQIMDAMGIPDDDEDETNGLREEDVHFDALLSNLETLNRR